MKRLIIILISGIAVALLGCNTTVPGGGGGGGSTTTQWTKLSGVAAKNTTGFAVAIDSTGNTYVTGSTTGSLDGETLTGTEDVFIKKYDPTGVVLWTKLVGVASKFTIGNGIAVDSSGNVYVTGTTEGNLTSGGASTGSTDVFIIKYCTSGTQLWKDQIGVATKTTEGNAIAVDSSGNAYFTGKTYGALNGVSVTGTADAFVIKYNSAGTRQWTKLQGVASSTTIGYAIAVDSSGNIYMAGQTDGNLNGVTKTGWIDFALIKFDSSGTTTWTKLLGGGAGTGNTYGFAIAVDSSANCYITGETDCNLDGKTKTGVADIFVLKYNTSGTLQWSQLIGVAAKQTRGKGISVDSSANAYVTGETNGNLDGQTLTGTNYNVLAIKYNTTGVKQWTKLLGVAGVASTGRGIAVESGGITHVTGDTYGNLDGQTKTGSNDAFATTKLIN